MYTHITFDECLKLFLTTLDIRMSQLAKAINVDSSLVNRWVNGKRIPSSAYIGDITDYLARNTLSPLQQKLVNEIFLSLGIDTNEEKRSNEEIFRRVLNRALAHSQSSLKTKKLSLAQGACCIPVKDPEPGILHSIPLSSKDRLLYGMPSIYSALLVFLKNAAGCRIGAKDRTIYLTFLNNLDKFFFTEQRLAQLRYKYMEVISNGWQITFLFRLDYSIDTIIYFIHFILPLIKTGKVNLYYLKNYETLYTRKELYVLPEIGALSCFPADKQPGIYSAFCLNSQAAVNVLHTYVKQLLKNNASSLIKHYKKAMNDVYFQDLTKAVSRTGNQFYYNSSFSKFLIPVDMYKKFLDKSDLTENDKHLSLQYYQQKSDSFYRSLEKSNSKMIYFITTLDKLCENKMLYLYTCVGIQIIFIENREIIDYLEYVIQILKKYNNYSIAIVYNTVDDFIDDTTIFIKERTAVFLYVYEPAKREENVRLSIQDSAIVKAFTEYYNSLWSKISPYNKDKQDIIQILEDRIQLLKGELSSE